MRLDIIRKPPARRSYEENLRATANPLFKYALAYGFQTEPGNVARFHVSGDFFSQPYIKACFFAIRQNPDKQFFAFSKSLHLRELSFSGKPRNLRLISSHNKGQHRAVVIDNPADVPDGFILCPGNCGEDPGNCDYCWKSKKVRVAFWDAAKKRGARSAATRKERRSNDL